MDGRALAARIREELKVEIAGFGPVRLATVLVGDDPASHVYIRLKHKAADDVGIHAIDKRLPGDTSEEELLVLIEELNGDDSGRLGCGRGCRAQHHQPRRATAESEAESDSASPFSH